MAAITSTAIDDGGSTETKKATVLVTVGCPVLRDFQFFFSFKNIAGKIEIKMHKSNIKNNIL